VARVVTRSKNIRVSSDTVEEIIDITKKGSKNSSSQPNKAMKGELVK